MDYGLLATRCMRLNDTSRIGWIRTTTNRFYFELFVFISAVSIRPTLKRRQSVRINEITGVWTMLMDGNLASQAQALCAVRSSPVPAGHKSSLRCHQVGRDGYGRRWLEAKCSTECRVAVYATTSCLEHGLEQDASVPTTQEYWSRDTANASIWRAFPIAKDSS